MEITVKDRLALLDILPKEGNIITLKVMRELRESLSFSEEEIKQYDLRVTDKGMVSVRTDMLLSVKDIQMGDKAKEIIQDTLKKLNSQNRLKEDHINLWDKFEMEKHND